MAVEGGGGGSSAPVVVLEFGGGALRSGWASAGAAGAAPRAMPAVVAKAKGERKPFVGDQLSACADVSQLVLRRAHEGGIVTNWEMLRQLWERALLLPAGDAPAGGAKRKDGALTKVDVGAATLLVSEPVLDLPACQASLAELAMKTFGFAAVAAVPAALMAHYGAVRQGAVAAAAGHTPPHTAAETRCSLVVDAGFSATHAVPVFGDRIVRAAVRRANVGGKTMTNYLKELVSYRAVNMMDEYYIIDDVKEKLCFVSADVREDLLLSKKGPGGRLSPYRATYVLPDGVHVSRGFVKPSETVAQRKKVDAALAGLSEEDAAAALKAATLAGGGAEPARGGGAGGKKAYEEQSLVLNNERFAVPEILFRPSDLGAPQAGIADAIVQAAQACHPDVQELLYGAVVVTGGCANMPGFIDRLKAELRPMVPDRFELNIVLSDGAGGPEAAAWRGGCAMASGGAGAPSPLAALAVTREEWQRGGAELCAERWAKAFVDL